MATLKRMTASARRRQAARQQVCALVRSGAIPHPSDQACFDCKFEPASSYDHHLGYGPEHVLDVQPVCMKCHAARSVARGEVRGAGIGKDMDFMRGPVWDAMQRAGMDPRGLALRTGIERARLDLYLRGWRVTPEHRQRLASALEVDFWALGEAV